MAKIIKTELHPNGDKRVTLYPKTSIDQIEGYVEKDVDLYEHSILIQISTFRVKLSIISKSDILFTYDTLLNFLNTNGYYGSDAMRSLNANGFSQQGNIIVGVSYENETSIRVFYGYDSSIILNKDKLLSFTDIPHKI